MKISNAPEARENIEHFSISCIRAVIPATQLRHSREGGNPVLFQYPGPPAEPVPAKAGAGVTIPFERKGGKGGHCTFCFFKSGNRECVIKYNVPLFFGAAGEGRSKPEAVSERQADQEQEQDTEAAFDHGQRVDTRVKRRFTEKGYLCTGEGAP